MNYTQEQLKWMDKMMDLLEEHLGPDCEITLYRLGEDLEQSILDIRNGHISGRRPGESARKFVGLEISQGTARAGDRYNLILQTRDAKILRSSQAFFRDENGMPLWALCLNTNITQSVKFESFLRTYNNYSMGPAEQGRPADVRGMLDNFLDEGQRLVGKPVAAMTKEDKMAMIKYLDEVGAFLITKSSDRICEHLGISRFTLYHYLDLIKGGAKS